MTVSEGDFYVVGGTLRRDAPSYVVREADEQLYQGLRQGKFCYVLTSRQMGKSSLMVRTVTRFRQEGVAVAVLDMTALGQNLTAEQWYDGLLGRLGQQLDLEDELEDYWLDHQRTAPLQRWTRALREVVLPAIEGPVIVFIDEIDAVRSLPFSTDEFFAAIREVYNRRSEDPELNRLTFCLLGVATPSDLIRDSRTTPFNIGTRIELADFTVENAHPLARGLDRPGVSGRRLLARVLHWTHGHPYLTQRLCLEVARSPEVRAPRDVDRVCRELFLSPRARERDDNLLFVRERILHRDVDRAAVLDLYLQILKGHRVRDDETNPLTSVLRLSGIVRAFDGRLRVRNRVYAYSFNKRWVRDNLPDAEVRRQRVAFRRGLIGAASLAGVIITVILLLAAGWRAERNRASRSAQVARAQAERANKETARAEEEARRARQAEKKALEAEQKARREAARASAEAKRANLEAQRAEQARARAIRLQEELRSQAERARDLLAVNAFQTLFEQDPTTASVFLTEVRRIDSTPGWRAHAQDALGVVRSLAVFGQDQNRVVAATMNPTHTQIALAFHDGRIVLAPTSGRGPWTELPSPGSVPNLMTFNSAGTSLALAAVDGSIHLIAIGADTPPVSLAAGARVNDLRFTPAGNRLAAGLANGTILVWSVQPLQDPVVYTGHKASVNRVAFDPQGKVMLSASDDGTIRRWQLRPPGSKVIGDRDARAVLARFHPRDGSVWAAYADGMVLRWSPRAEEKGMAFSAGRGRISALLPLPDRSDLLTACADGSLICWTPGQDPAPPAGTPLAHHDTAITAAAVDRKGHVVATGTLDGLVLVTRLEDPKLHIRLVGHQDSISGIWISPDGETALTLSRDGTARTWPTRPPPTIPTTPLTPEELRTRLQASTSVCIPVALRVRFLAETPAEAARRHRKCEQEYGRPAHANDDIARKP